MGLIIRVASTRSRAESIEVIPKNPNITQDLDDAPNFVRLWIKTQNESGIFHYRLMERFMGNTSDQNEILMEEKVTNFFMSPVRARKRVPWSLVENFKRCPL